MSSPNKFNVDAFLQAYLGLGKVARDLDLLAIRAADFDSNNAEYILCQDKEIFVGLAKDKVVTRKLYINGDFELEKLVTAIRICGRSIETIIDVGANIGTTCIPAIQRSFVRQAIAIEPEPTNFRLLMANIYLNNLQDRIAAINVAAGPIDGETVVMELSEDNMGDHRIRQIDSNGQFNESTRRTVFAKSESLNSLISGFANLNLESTIVWIDAQGFEGHILNGASRIIERKCPLVIEFWPYGMKRVGSYPLVKDSLVGRYSNFFVLSEPDPQPHLLTLEALDRLVGIVGFDGAIADLLFI